MALLTLEEATARLGVARQTIDDWLNGGLFSTQKRLCPTNLPSGAPGSMQVEECVDEEQLLDLAESLGWLQLNGETWDSDEDQ